MILGTFSVSLNVKSLNASRSFYEKIGFEVFGGESSQNWLIMRNDKVTIGLFQGMFEKNILTFNPGWDESCNKLDSYTDVREIQKSLKSQSVKIDKEVEANGSGPGNFILEDPDGNAIMFDQHV